jgi:alkanesulfonate monooxygenase SsuD/methylene tetrahydromethanopterin reductase-like flavin-dependent oxidoreductase (luciferase family)
VRDVPLSAGWIVQPALFDIPPGTPPGSWDLARSILGADDQHAQLAIEGGFDTIWVEDHMDWGDKAHLECLTTLAWLAGRHQGPRYGTMVCGQGFRHPSYLAKASVNLQLVTEGRFILGIGAGNNGGEHHGFGFPFPAAPERIDAMAEQIRIMRALWTGERTHLQGANWTIDGAILAPAPQPPIPVMIGGGGEKRTLRLVAEAADWWCADIEDVETFRRKSAVLDRHCAAVGRDPAEIVRSQVTWVSVEDDPERVVRWPDLHIVAGSVDEVTRELEAFADAGVKHVQVRFMDFPGTAGMERFVSRVLPRLQG